MEESIVYGNEMAGINVVSPNSSSGEFISNVIPKNYNEFELGAMPWVTSVKASQGSFLAIDEFPKWEPNNSVKLEAPDAHFVPRSSISMAAADEIDNKWKGDDAVMEHIQLTSPGVTESSNGSRSTMNVSSSSSGSFGERKHPKPEARCEDDSSKIIVKHAYSKNT
ncbi:Hypothetical predicted protein [Olea europaea subsp. europaea]|nr:Hypothetical predicted protein [Olea europaea subsp. europaea]